MKKNVSRHMLAAIVALSAAVALPSLAMAKVSGACGDCHTMHNSQDGAAMASTGAFGEPIVADTANGALLRYGCVGCHTGDNDGVSVPFVLSSAAGGPSYGTDTLAGGNFYWVTQDAGKGHNVDGIPGVTTDSLSAAPGAASGATNVPSVNELTCAGANGCHGDRSEPDQFGAVAGGHHGSGGVAVGTTHTYTSGHAEDMSAAFRMLAGIKGIEVNDWEYGATAAANDGTTDHNQYYGVGRGGEDETAAGSISSLCAQCHGDFHNGSNSVLPTDATTFSSPWVRHPTDFDMATAKGSEYAYYNGGDGTGTADYSVIAPVATENMTGAAGDVLATVNVTTGTADGSAIVTCISCHRAHGSPNADLLRWDYSTMNAHGGDSNNGCFVCHTTKDDA